MYTLCMFINIYIYIHTCTDWGFIFLHAREAFQYIPILPAISKHVAIRVRGSHSRLGDPGKDIRHILNGQVLAFGSVNPKCSPCPLLKSLFVDIPRCQTDPNHIMYLRHILDNVYAYMYIYTYIVYIYMCIHEVHTYSIYK